jgi:hydroxyacylglutathione hydrolase
VELAPDLHGFFWRDQRVNNCNAYLVRGRVPVLIDPGHTAYLGTVQEELALLGTTARGVGVVLVTHGHPDHLEGAAAFTTLPARLALHEEEAAWLSRFQEAFYRAQGASAPELAFDFLLREGELRAGEHVFQVLHTPGHSPGSICLYWPERKALFAGDVVFYAGLGRTDLPGGDPRKLKESVERLAELELEWLLPGHGGPVKGREAIRRNFDAVREAYLSYL